jgi:hypothetical protein
MRAAWKCDEMEFAELREFPPVRPKNPATQPSPLAAISILVVATCPRIGPCGKA